jgi:hypothetical protein
MAKFVLLCHIFEYFWMLQLEEAQKKIETVEDLIKRNGQDLKDEMMNISEKLEKVKIKWFFLPPWRRKQQILSLISIFNKIHESRCTFCSWASLKIRVTAKLMI